MSFEIVGRKEDRARVEAFIGRDECGASALVLEGEAGIGKSTLWLEGVQVERDFSSFSASVLQIEDARIYAGFHFRFSCVAGATLGASVGAYVLGHVALPVHGKKVGQLKG